MGQNGSTGATNVVYDLVSIQYHALKGASLYDAFIKDAKACGVDEIATFIQQVKEEDRLRALRCHELLAQYTQVTGGIIDLSVGQLAGAGGGNR